MISEAGTNFEIHVANHSDQPITVHDQLVGGPGAPPILIEIQDSSGARIDRCSSVDYLSTPRDIEVASRDTETLLVPVSAVSLTHCLRRGDEYRIRVSLTASPHAMQFSSWTTFRAIWNVEPERTDAPNQSFKTAPSARLN
jgi:hypothetical protein